MATNVLRGRQARLFLDSSSGSTGVAFGAVTAWTLRRETRITQLDSTGNARVRMPAAPVSWSLQVNALTLSSGAGGQETLRGLLSSGGRYYVRLYNESTVGATAVVQTTGYSAAFTGANGTQIGSYTEDSPGTLGFSACNTLVIQSNAMRCSANSGSVARSRSNGDSSGSQNNCTIQVNLTRPTTHVASRYAGLVFRATSSTGGNCTIAGDYLYLRMRMAGTSTAPAVQISIRQFAAGVEADASTDLTQTYSWPAGTAKTLGMDLSGDAMTAWTSDTDGSNKTTHGTWTPTSGYNSTANRRIGLVAQSAGSADANEWIYDNLKVLYNTSSATPRQAWRGYAHVGRWTQAGMWTDVQRHNVTLQGNGALSLST